MVLEEDTQRDRYLIFALSRESYGLEIRCVKEIVGMQPITELPEAPEYVKGVINLRGKVIPVIDMRLKFGKEPSAYTDRTCIIVVEIGEESVGLIADSVTEVLSIGDGSIVPPPQVSSGAEHVKSIGKVGSDVKLILDCGKLMNSELNINQQEE
jgi:purine-binding chemotaxis protein CheW